MAAAASEARRAADGGRAAHAACTLQARARALQPATRLSSHPAAPTLTGPHKLAEWRTRGGQASGQVRVQQSEVAELQAHLAANPVVGGRERKARGEKGKEKKGKEKGKTGEGRRVLDL
jgi:hypothetical protein